MERWRTTGMVPTDLSDVSLLNANILNSVGMTAGAVAKVAEVRKHAANDQKCNELGRSYVPLAVETYGSWGREPGVLLASRLAVHTSSSKSTTTFNLYSRLNLV